MMPFLPLSLCYQQLRHRKYGEDEAESRPLLDKRSDSNSVQADLVDAGAQQSRKQSLDGMDSDADDKLIDESNIESLVRDLPQATDRTVQFLDNLLAVLPNR